MTSIIHAAEVRDHFEAALASDGIEITRSAVTAYTLDIAIAAGDIERAEGLLDGTWRTSRRVHQIGDHWEELARIESEVDGVAVTIDSWHPVNVEVKSA